jgi:uncharacterized protein YacL
MLVVQALFVLISAATAVYFRPSGEPVWSAGLLGAALGAAGLALAWRIARMSLQRLLGMGGGVMAALVCAALASVVLGSTGRFIHVSVMLLFIFIGGVAGAAKSDLINLAAFGGIFGAEKDTRSSQKILDTSVIIDGRIADIAETGFLDGTLVVPQFVLQELQMVADSADSMKRNRGRRGLDVLQRIQKMPGVKVQIVAEDFPGVKEVDMKLIELARLYGCRIVTNDFNLNKVAHVRGVEVFNINDLANSLKPIVLPGELMRVFILKEGKEQNQGVAYLDDGTMVVVDNARRMISKTIDVSVTSVLQTTAGKMIFGKFDERFQSATPQFPDRREAARREQAVGE